MVRNLTRFIQAQNNTYGSYANALTEFRDFGHKVSHWIWYIFPQLEHEFPGQSYNKRYFGIQGMKRPKLS